MKATSPLFQALRSHPLFAQIHLPSAVGKFVIVDPMDPDSLLYLTRKRYEILLGQAMSNDEMLVVLLRPGEIIPQGASGFPLVTPPTAGGASGSSDSDGSRITPHHSVSDEADFVIHPVEDSTEPDASPFLEEGTDSPKGSTGPNLDPSSMSTDHTFSIFGIPPKRPRVPFSGQDFSDLLIPKLDPLGKRSYSLQGQLRYFPRLEVAPNFLEVTDKSIGPIMREWGVTLYLRIFGKSLPISLDRHLKDMVSFIKHLNKEEGGAFTLKYLKASGSFCLAYLSGNPLSDPWTFQVPVGLAHGLPKWIPSEIRSNLRAGHVGYWRWVLSFLNSYKGLMVSPPKASLQTIASEPWDEAAGMPALRLYFSSFPSYLQSMGSDLSDLKTLRKGSSGKPCDMPTYNQNLPVRRITTSGPNGGPSVARAGLDALCWAVKGSDCLLGYLKSTGNLGLKLLFDLSLVEASRFVVKRPDRPLSEGVVRTLLPGGKSLFRPVGALNLGRLSLKFEAAGKVRVFAMVDYWTQCALGPLHDAIFSALKGLSSDATFDQGATLLEFAQRRNQKVSCFDLTAATDIIPAQIQSRLLREFIGEVSSDLWYKLMVDRDYAVPSGTSHPDPTIRYTRGQPMGALSSWAILALTHHFLVYVSHLRSGGSMNEPYTNYVICGDDIALGGDKVPAEYSRLCSELGIPISAAKSIVSTSGSHATWSETGAAVNFVSRIIIGETDLTPWSLKDEISISSLSGRAQSVFRQIGRRQIDLGNNFLHEIVQAGLSRRSDVEKISKAFTSGEISDHLAEFLTPILFPSSQARAILGLTGHDINLWLSVLSRDPTVLSYGVKALEEAPKVKGFPYGDLMREFAGLVWNRLLSHYEVAVFNFTSYEEWCRTMHCTHSEISHFGSVPMGFMSVPSLTRVVLAQTVSRDLSSLNQILSTALPLMKEMVMSEQSDTRMTIVMLKLFELLQDSPTPTRLEFATGSVQDILPRSEDEHILASVKISSDDPASGGIIVLPDELDTYLMDFTPMTNRLCLLPGWHTGAHIEPWNPPASHWDPVPIESLDVNLFLKSSYTRLHNYLAEFHCSKPIIDFTTLWDVDRDSDEFKLLKARVFTSGEHPLTLATLTSNRPTSDILYLPYGAAPSGASWRVSTVPYGAPVSTGPVSSGKPLPARLASLDGLNTGVLGKWLGRRLRRPAVPAAYTRFPNVITPYRVKDIRKTAYGISTPGTVFNDLLILMQKARIRVPHQRG